MVAIAFRDRFFRTDRFPAAGGDALHFHLGLIQCQAEHAAGAYLPVGENKGLRHGIIIARQSAEKIGVPAKDLFETMQDLFPVGFDMADTDEQGRVLHMASHFHGKSMGRLPVILVRIRFQVNLIISGVEVHQQHHPGACSGFFINELATGGTTENGDTFCIQGVTNALQVLAYGTEYNGQGRHEVCGDGFAQC